MARVRALQAVSAVAGLLARGHEDAGARGKRLARRFDLCTATTRAEWETLEGYGTGAPTDWFPNGVDSDVLRAGGRAPTTPTRSRFVGRMDYYPNQECMSRFLRAHVWPLLQGAAADDQAADRRRRPVACGAAGSGELPGVTVTGSVPDVRPYVRRSALMVAPLQHRARHAEQDPRGDGDGRAGGHQQRRRRRRRCRRRDASARGRRSPHEIRAGDPAHRWTTRSERAAPGRGGPRSACFSHHAWPSSMQRLDGIIERCLASSLPRSAAQLQERTCSVNISIFGLGYVGAVSLACLARDGHQVIGVDIDPAKLDLIRDGKTPVVEEGMVELMAQVVGERPGLGHHATCTQAILGHRALADLRRHAVGAERQPGPGGDAAPRPGARARACATRREPHVFVFRSTLVPGTVEEVLRPILERESGKKDGVDFHVCFQPEFLREGSSIRDYDKPPFTIVGANPTLPVERLRRLFGHLPCEFIATSIRAAEMVKYCCNNFHALKITFANETARAVRGAGRRPVRGDGPGLQGHAAQHLAAPTSSPDSRSAARACRRTCAPRCTWPRSATSSCRCCGGILPSNRAHIDHAIAQGSGDGQARIGMIGLSFKTGTDDLRESPLVTLAEHFIGKGFSCWSTIPRCTCRSLLGANRRFIEQHLPHIGSLMRPDIAEVIGNSEVVVVGMSDERVVDGLERICGLITCFSI